VPSKQFKYTQSELYACKLYTLCRVLYTRTDGENSFFRSILGFFRSILVRSW